MLLTMGIPSRGRAEGVSYNFQVRPILAQHCLKCHGQDEKQRKAKLRLRLTGTAPWPKKHFVPESTGQPDQSEMIKRILTHEEDDVMPPTKEHRPVSDEELAVLKKWIAEGAPFEKHWAFIPPVKPPVPDLSNLKSQIPNPIDAFVQSRLEKERLTPAAPASREEWLRRVTLVPYWIATDARGTGRLPE